MRQAGLWLIALAIVVATLAAAPSATAHDGHEPVETVAIEVRVWQHTADPLRISISARPEGGSWAALGTIPLPLDDGFSRDGRYRYGDITVEAPLAHGAARSVAVRVWQRIADPLRIYVSARPEGGLWNALGTIPLPLDDGFSRSGRYRYGDITVETLLPEAATPEGAERTE